LISILVIISRNSVAVVDVCVREVELGHQAFQHHFGRRNEQCPNVLVVFHCCYRDNGKLYCLS